MLGLESRGCEKAKKKKRGNHFGNQAYGWEKCGAVKITTSVIVKRGVGSFRKEVENDKA